MSEVFVLGLDLAGPANPEATVAAGFRVDEDALSLAFFQGSLDDAKLVALIETELPASSRIVVGLDAPLSYQVGGAGRVGLEPRPLSLGPPG